MSIASAAFWRRLGWMALWGGLATVAYWLTDNLSTLHLPLAVLPAAYAILAAITKYISVKQKEGDGQ